ncbi:MAG TPA: nuclear transport factor 2 family protein, partial [Solirubrobacteraceae bacterium]|nr:nuclear transport factor 2 family protein [Solirubrobacteraceae bacterium]
MSTATASKPFGAEAASAAERWVSGFIEGWRAPRGPEAFAAHFREMLAPDVRLVQPQLPTAVGRAAFEEEFVGPLFEMFPDVRGEVERWAARGEHLYIELTLHATLAGRPIAWRVCDRVTLKDGQAIERESYFDPGPLLAAIARSPRSWPTFLRARMSSRIRHLR